MKIERIMEALRRLQKKLIKEVLEEYPDERYPEDLDDRIGEIQNTISILDDINLEEEQI